MIPGQPAWQRNYGVPDLRLDDLRLQLDDFRGELDSQSWLMILLEVTIHVSREQAGLAHV